MSELLSSKKFLAAALASVLTFLGILFGMELDKIGLMTAPLYTYILSQGAADIGKGRAVVEASRILITKKP